MTARAIAQANERDDLADTARLSAPTASAVAKVLTMLNTWYRHRSFAPSYREIASLAGVSISRIRGYLDILQGMGHLTHTPGVDRSTQMADRCANICDDELERACHGRNWTIIKHPVGDALGLAFPLAPALPFVENAGGTDCIADFGELLGKIA